VLSYSFKQRCIILCLSHRGWKKPVSSGEHNQSEKSF